MSETPEQAERDWQESLPGNYYTSGEPKYHRHFADDRIYRAADCSKRHGSQSRVYVFDPDALAEHERFISERVWNEGWEAGADDQKRWRDHLHPVLTPNPYRKETDE